MRVAQVAVNVFMGFGLGCGNGPSQPSIPAPSQTDEKPEIQVRIFADRGVSLPNGRKGGAVQIYGMKVEEDGSERVDWRTFLFEFHGLKFPHDYRYLGLKRDRVFLYFPPHDGDELVVPARTVGFLELDRMTGEILRRAGPGDTEFERSRSQHSWASMTIIDRPSYDGRGSQIGSTEFKLPAEK